jgi:spore coat polysaccharide biosynthesis protein SpsF
MSSTRLPGKVLMRLGEHTVLELLMRRIARARELDAIVLATSTEASDDVIEQEGRRLAVPVIRGPLENVLARYEMACDAFQADAVVRITGDCPLSDPEVIDQVVRHWRELDTDYVTNTLEPRTYPDGVDVEVISAAVLRQAAREAARDEDREHVTPFIRCRPERFRTGELRLHPSHNEIRITLDTAEDAELLGRVVAQLGPDPSLSEIVTWFGFDAGLSVQRRPAPPTRVAVLGLGSIGSRHARNLLELGHQVVGFDPERTPDTPAVEPAASVGAAIAAADAVVIASPTSMHAEHALAALREGRPVLVEKPLAAAVSDAEQVARVAGERGLTCGVAMNLRFHPGVRKLRELLAAGRLGTTLYAQISCGSDLRGWHPGRDYRSSYSARASLGGGVVWDSIHELDYLTWLLGPAASITAEVAHASELEIDVEDIGLALVRLASGSLASVDLTYFDPAYRRGCLLVGSQASASWDWAQATIEVRSAEAGVETIAVPGEVADTYVAEVQDFLEAANDGRASSTTVQEGAATVRLADALFTSAREGRRVAL